MFRYDRPQLGRYRQFYQYGVEYFGSSHPSSDAEVIILALDFFKMLGLEDVVLQLNSVGCPECRPRHLQKVREQLSSRKEELCQDCRQRLDANTLRVLDCKREKCSELTGNIDPITSYLCDECREHFNKVQELLQGQGVNMKLEPRLVRGLDYYTRTAFEFISPSLGAQDSIGGGGRYDNLVEYMGGPSVPAVGFGLGIERILLSLPEASVDLREHRLPSVFVAVSGEDMMARGFQVARICRNAGGAAEVESTGRSLKAQMKYADKKSFDCVAILGETEREQDTVTLKNMESGEQDSIPLSRLEENMEKIINK